MALAREGSSIQRHRRERREEEGPKWRGGTGQGESRESVERIQAGRTEEPRGEMRAAERTKRVQRIKERELCNGTDGSEEEQGKGRREGRGIW